jgi:hypothetical protein
LFVPEQLCFIGLKKNVIGNCEMGRTSAKFKESPVTRPVGSGRKEDDAFVSSNNSTILFNERTKSAIYYH